MSITITKKMLSDGIRDAKLKAEFKRTVKGEIGDQIINQYQDQLTSLFDDAQDVNYIQIEDNVLYLGSVSVLPLDATTRLICISSTFDVDSLSKNWAQFYCIEQDGKLQSPSIGLTHSDFKQMFNAPPFSFLSTGKFSKNKDVQQAMMTFLENVEVLLDGSKTFKEIYGTHTVQGISMQMRLELLFCDSVNLRKDSVSSTFSDFALDVDELTNGIHDALSLRSGGLLMNVIKRVTMGLSPIVDRKVNQVVPLIIKDIKERQKSSKVQDALGDLWGCW